MPKFRGKGAPALRHRREAHPRCDNRIAAVGALTDKVTGMLMALPAPVIAMAPL